MGARRVLLAGVSEIGVLGLETCLENTNWTVHALTKPWVKICDRINEADHDLAVVVALLPPEVTTAFDVCRTALALDATLATAIAAPAPDFNLRSDAAFIGARACLDLCKPCPAIIEQLAVVLKGGALLSHDEISHGYRIENLTAREVDVLTCAANRWTLQQIAQELGTARGTVRNQLAEIRAKLYVSSTRDAVARARRIGLLIPS